MVRVFSCRCNVALSRSISRIERRNIRWFSRRISEVIINMGTREEHCTVGDHVPLGVFCFPHNQKDMLSVCRALVVFGIVRFFHGSAARKIVTFFPPFRLYWPFLVIIPDNVRVADDLFMNIASCLAFIFAFRSFTHVFLYLLFIVTKFCSGNYLS